MTDSDNQKPFSELFSGAERSLSGFVFSLVPNRADADDVLELIQDASHRDDVRIVAKPHVFFDHEIERRFAAFHKGVPSG